MEEVLQSHEFYAAAVQAGLQSEEQPQQRIDACLSVRQSALRAGALGEELLRFAVKPGSYLPILMGSIYDHQTFEQVQHSGP